MKPFTTIILSSILTLIAFSATAAPFHYTFSGSINYIEVDGAFLSDIDFDGDYATVNDTFRVGDVIEYTFLVDFDLPGFCAGPLGTSYSSTCTSIDILDSATANYFFTDLVAATKLAPPTEEGTTFNYGLSIANLGSLIADSAVFVVSPLNQPVGNWKASTATTNGTLLIGTDAWAAPNGNSPYGRIHSILTLTSITPVTVNTPTGECKKDDDEDDHSNDNDEENDSDYNDNDDDENNELEGSESPDLSDDDESIDDKDSKDDENTSCKQDKDDELDDSEHDESNNEHEANNQDHTDNDDDEADLDHDSSSDQKGRHGKGKKLKKKKKRL